VVRGAGKEVWQPTAWLMPPVFEMIPDAASRYLTACNMGRTAFIYHSERFLARATHIQHCPREPREVRLASGQQFPPANRVRSATATGSVGSHKT
jgi:hypothetical protein